MRYLMVLFMIICLAFIPVNSYSRDIEKYTSEHNAYTAYSMGIEIYKFVKGVERFENTWPNHRHILVNIFDIIDKYNCSGKLYVINRGLSFEFDDNKIRYIKIKIYVMVSTGMLDIVTMRLDVKKIKDGVPLKKFENGRIDT